MTQINQSELDAGTESQASQILALSEKEKHATSANNGNIV